MSAAAASYEYITVTVAGQMFGLPIDRVRDVFFVTDLTPVPQAPAEIAGLMNLRGRVTTAVDLSFRLGLGRMADTGKRLAVGIDLGGDPYGLLVEEVGEVVRLPADTREDAPAHLDEGWSALVLGIHRLDDRLLLVLDVDAIFDLPLHANAA